MSSCMWLRRSRGVTDESYRSTNRTSQVSSSSAPSASSLSPSQLDQVIMDMLNITPDNTFLTRSCNDNPVTKTGKRMQVLRLLGTVMVPIIALMAMVGSIFVSQIQGYISTQEVRQSIWFSIRLTDLLNVLQRERDMSAFYHSAIGPETKTVLLEAYKKSDHALDSLPEWVVLPTSRSELRSQEAFVNYLNRHRYNLDLVNPKPQEELDFYTDIMDALMVWFYSAISEARSGTVWKDLVAIQELLAARDYFGIERAMGAIFYTRGGFADMDEYRRYAEGLDRGTQAIKAAREFSANLDRIFNDTLTVLRVDQQRLYSMRTAITENIQEGLLMGVNQSLEKANNYFDNMTTSMDIYLRMQRFLTVLVDAKLQKTLNEETVTVIILGVLFGFVIILCPIITKSVYSLTTDIQSYSMTLVARTKALNKEKHRTESLLYQMLPKTVAEQLKKNEVINAENFSEATIFFSDIVGFTSISARSSPIQVVNMLNSLYTCFDGQILKYDVYKVETIGDAYMVASGLPRHNGKRHMVEIACLSLDLMEQVADLLISHMPGKSFRMRIGVNSGSVVAGVVGVKMPRYCLFGKTVSIASLLESSGLPCKVHISEITYNGLTEHGGFVMKERTNSLKEVGLKTYWLVCREGYEKAEDKGYRSPDNLSPVYADQFGAMNAYEVDYEDDIGNMLIHRRSSDEMSEVVQT